MRYARNIAALCFIMRNNKNKANIKFFKTNTQNSLHFIETNVPKIDFITWVSDINVTKTFSIENVKDSTINFSTKFAGDSRKRYSRQHKAFSKPLEDLNKTFFNLTWPTSQHTVNTYKLQLKWRI